MEKLKIEVAIISIHHPGMQARIADYLRCMKKLDLSAVVVFKPNSFSALVALCPIIESFKALSKYWDEMQKVKNFGLYA